jgi:hypothetical protein
LLAFEKILVTRKALEQLAERTNPSSSRSRGATAR